MTQQTEKERERERERERRERERHTDIQTDIHDTEYLMESHIRCDSRIIKQERISTVY